MKNLRIEKILVEKNLELKYLNTPELRADALLEFLEIEYNNNKNIDLVSSIKKGLSEMFNEMGKSEMLTELDFSIKTLKRFQETGNFDLITISNVINNDLANKFESIKSLIISIVK